MLIVDAHLDLAYNAVRGRDVTAPASTQVADEQGIPSVWLPDLRAGGVGLICATIFCEPDDGTHGGYRDAESARAMALKQLDWYRRQIADGRMRFIVDGRQLDGLADGAGQRAILLLEGADPLRGTED